jgi:predicted MFS family arabinose efflux permease
MPSAVLLEVRMRKPSFPLAAPLAPFAVRSFRFQWPADLLSSWAWEMEALILGWFVLVETGSVTFLTLFGAFAFIGTLFAPFTGVLADRWGRRGSLCAIRAFLAAMSCIIMTLAFLDLLRPAHVLPIVFLAGLVRPSDLVMRNSLIGDTMTPDKLMSALGLARVTMDSARIAGALAGTSLFAALGIGPAYLFVAGFYVLSFLFTLGVSHVQQESRTDVAAPLPSGMIAARWRELREGLSYSWSTPAVLGLMWLAFFVNFFAFPPTHSLMPYVAREVFHIDARGLGHLVAAFASGALLGSIIMTVAGDRLQSSRFMMTSMIGWYLMLGIFAWIDTLAVGLAVLFVTGLIHNFTMVSLSGVLLRDVEGRFRARVMGIRMLAVYGMPLGLLLSGPLIERFGYDVTVTLYVAGGIVMTVWIGTRWRRSLWVRS